MLPGCIFWTAPLPDDDQLADGLIVLYPGVYNSEWELQGFYEGLRATGNEAAIEIMPWSGPLEQWFFYDGFVAKTQTWAEGEAQRIADYKNAHADAPVTLVGYSGGAMAAIYVAERMPASTPVDRVILMSPGVSRYYDLSAMLDNTSQGAMAYWSPADTLAVTLVRKFGTVDGDHDTPAARYGFATEDERLTQIAWDPNMATRGNHGNHLDYLRAPDWIRDFVGPWIAD